MARYQPRRLDPDLSAPHGGHTPRRLRRGRVEPKRLAAASRRPSTLGVLLLAAALTLTAALGGTAARYIKDWSDKSLVTAENFYFTSKELDGKLHSVATNASGEVVFPFTLQNYLVAGHHTPRDIAYDCFVTDSSGAAVESARLELKNTDGTWGLSGAGDDVRELFYTIPKSAFGPEGNKELDITVRSTTPYAAVLTARLALGTSDVRLVVTDPGGRGGAVTVTLYNTGTEACTGTLKMVREDRLILVPDPTWEVDPSGPLTIQPGEAVSVVYVKRSALDSFTEADFSFAS